MTGALRVVYVVNQDWFFLSHRLPMARAAKAAGFEVHVATNVGDGGAAIEREGFILHPVPPSGSPRRSPPHLHLHKRHSRTIRIRWKLHQKVAISKCL